MRNIHNKRNNIFKQKAQTGAVQFVASFIYSFEYHLGNYYAAKSRMSPAYVSISAVGYKFFVGKSTNNTNISNIYTSFLTYDTYCQSFAGIINEICTLSSAVLALLHYKKSNHR